MSSADAAAPGDPSGGADADADHETALQAVIAVDPDDAEQGTVNRLDAHTGDGIRHRGAERARRRARFDALNRVPRLRRADE